MSDALKRQRGFSLPETMLAVALVVLAVTALGDYQRGMAQGIVQLNQTRQLWRDAWCYNQLSAPPSPACGQVNRVQTSTQKCVSITITISTSIAKQVQMTRLHCPVSQQSGAITLRIYHSNRLGVLEALMGFIVGHQRLDDPFQAKMVLVQSTGIAQWLQMTLTSYFGIAANVEFPLPASFV